MRRPPDPTIACRRGGGLLLTLALATEPSRESAGAADQRGGTAIDAIRVRLDASYVANAILSRTTSN